MLWSIAATHDDNDSALRAVLAEWTSMRTYSERVQNLRGQANPTFAARANGNRYWRSGIEVQADAGGNVLSGLADRDWFFLAVGDINDALPIEALNSNFAVKVTRALTAWDDAIGNSADEQLTRGGNHFILERLHCDRFSVDA